MIIVCVILFSLLSCMSLIFSLCSGGTAAFFTFKPKTVKNSVGDESEATTGPLVKPQISYPQTCELAVRDPYVLWLLGNAKSWTDDDRNTAITISNSLKIPEITSDKTNTQLATAMSFCPMVKPGVTYPANCEESKTDEYFQWLKTNSYKFWSPDDRNTAIYIAGTLKIPKVDGSKTNKEISSALALCPPPRPPVSYPTNCMLAKGDKYFKWLATYPSSWNDDDRNTAIVIANTLKISYATAEKSNDQLGGILMMSRCFPAPAS